MPAKSLLPGMTLKCLTMVLLAALACTTPAAAQTLNVADTLAYINEHCEGAQINHEGVGLRTTDVDVADSRLSIQYNRVILNNGSIPRLHITSSFDLRRVDIARANWFVKFSCGVRNCMSTLSHKDDSSSATYWARHGDRDETSSTEIYCRDADRVINAFEHLQQLLGGRMADPVDPFAN